MQIYNILYHTAVDCIFFERRINYLTVCLPGHVMDNSYLFLYLLISKTHEANVRRDARLCMRARVCVQLQCWISALRFLVANMYKCDKFSGN